MNPYSFIVSDTFYLSAIDRLLREFATDQAPQFDAHPRPLDGANPFAAVLQLGLPDQTIYRRLRPRLQSLAGHWDDEQARLKELAERANQN